MALAHVDRFDQVPDVVQEVALRLTRSLDQFRGDSQLRSWLGRITINAARDVWRNEQRTARAREAVEQSPEPIQVMDPDQVVTTGRRMAAVRDAMAQLTDCQRDAVLDHLRPGAVLSRRKTTRWHGMRRLRSILCDDPRLQD